MDSSARQNGKRDKVIIIVPAYNEAANIEDVISDLRTHTSFDFIVINDGSTDATAAILDRLGVPHIDLFKNLGIGGAVQTGYRYALSHGYDIAVQFDGDGQHDVHCIDCIVEPLQNHEVDFVVGSRFLETSGEFKSTFARRAGIRFLSNVLKLVSGQRIWDVTSGFRAAGPKAIALFAQSYPSDYPEPESLSRILSCGVQVQEVPVTMHARTGGVSSIGGFSVVYYMVKVSLAIALAWSYRGRR